MEIVLYDAGRDKKRLVSEQFSKLPFINVRAAAKYLGYSFLAASFLFLLVGFAPILKEEARYQVKNIFFREKNVYSEESANFENSKKAVAEEAAKYGVDTDFSIVIPKIGAASKVIANVDPADEARYKELLKNGVGHALGTKFPGSKGITYLFAHSTNNPENIVRYNAVFYLLKELAPGDEVIVFFAGQKFVYSVTENFITHANDLKWLSEEENEEKLVLQTCWPPGTTFKRLIVVSKPY